MAKKQTRRTVSINRALYERLKLAAAARGEAMSQITEKAITAAIATTAPSSDTGAAKVEALLARLCSRVGGDANKLAPDAWEAVVTEIMSTALRGYGQREGNAMIKGLTRHG